MAPAWLLTMRVLSAQGLREAPGDADNPVLLEQAKEIGRRFPELAAYAANFNHDAIPWCGHEVAYCLAVNGIRPPYVKGNDSKSYLWAKSFAQDGWGTELDTPKLGAIGVFTRNGGGHVSLYERTEGDCYVVRGGNQGDAVNETHMPKNQLTGWYWPPTAEKLPAAGNIPAPAEWESGKGSWYSQFQGRYSWVDEGDEPGSNALGVPDEAQGCAFYDRSTLGDWFEVKAPNGAVQSIQQTDIGPHPRTGRTIDIAAAAAERFGYTPKNFPTDGVFYWRPAQQEEQPMPTPAPAPASNDALIKALTGFVEIVGPVLLEKARDPAVQKGAASLVLKLLPSIGTLFPQLGIFGIAAGYVLPLLLPDLIGPTGGTATIATGASVVASSLFGLAKRAFDKFVAPPEPAQ